LTLSESLLAKDRELYQKYVNTYVKDIGRHITYGTAGFRTHQKYLDHVCLRVGLFQGLVAKLHPEISLGIVLSASHNPIEDNGLKQSDFEGDMLRREFEPLVEEFVIAEDL
jgi:phosphoacetylglucosamine mutase